MLGISDAITKWFLSTRLGRMPEVKRRLSTLRSVVANIVMPNRDEWVPIRSGIGAGLWLHLNPAEERHWSSGNHEPAVQERLRQCIHENTVFYDIGAHIGFFALAAAQLGAHVFAFEADPENLDRLKRHIEKNGLTNVITVVEAAVWSHGNEKIAFQRGLPRSQGGVTSQGTKPVLASGPIIEVDSVTIDGFIAAGGPVPQVIKIDVEGGEAEVLKGATKTINNFLPDLILEVHYREAVAEVEEFLKHLSYDAEWRIPAEGFPRQCFTSRALPRSSPVQIR